MDIRLRLPDDWGPVIDRRAQGLPRTEYIKRLILGDMPERQRRQISEARGRGRPRTSATGEPQ